MVGGRGAVAFGGGAPLTLRLFVVRRLIEKEQREHGWVLGALGLLAGVGLAVQLARADEAGGRFSALRGFVLVWGSLGALVAGNRLVVREYTGRTQLFLEALPIGRARVASAKWLFGLAWVWGLTAAAWAATWAFVAHTASLAIADAAFALPPALAWMAAVWSVCFAAGLLGRYRLLFWTIAAGLALGLDQLGGVHLAELPPAGLVSERLSVAGAWPRPVDLAAAGAVVALASLAGLWLATAGEGAIATTLSGRMTSRERLTAASAALVGLVLFTALAKDRQRPPFRLASAGARDTPAGPVGVLAGDGVTPERAAALLGTLEGDVTSFVEAMGMPPLPGVYVVSQGGLDPDVVVRVPLGERDGVVMQANLADPRLDALGLRSLVLHAVMAEHTRDRGLQEDRHWLLDGLTMRWAARGDPEARALLRRRAAAAPLALSPLTVARWDETFERAGACFGAALGFTLVDALVDALGEAAVLDVTRRVLGRPRGDVRDALFEPKLERELAALGVSVPQLVGRAEAARRAGGPAGPGYEGAVEVLDQGGRQRRLRFSLRRDGEPVARFSGLSARAGPWETYLREDELARVDAREARALASGVFAAGERVFLAIEVDDEALGCRVRVHQAWQVLQ